MEGGINHLQGPNLPSVSGVIDIVSRLETLLFPGFFQQEVLDDHSLSAWTNTTVGDVHERLRSEIFRDLFFEHCRAVEVPDAEDCRRMADELAVAFLGALAGIRGMLSQDVEALLAGDPAARSREEIILSYPGLRAIAVHRMAHWFWLRGVRLIARMMSEHIHSRTGIDIHPGAQIGSRFYIDHGTGVVIGETTVIGDRVKIYQGVSLGALSVSKALNGRKRHPTIEHDVTIYAGATILGGDTVVGRHSVIGGNVWLVHSVPASSRVENAPQIRINERTLPKGR